MKYLFVCLTILACSSTPPKELCSKVVSVKPSPILTIETIQVPCEKVRRSEL